MVYYITTLLVYAGVDAIACLGLSQQFGIAGITNFGFIIFQAAGAYAAAVLSLPANLSIASISEATCGRSWGLRSPICSRRSSGSPAKLRWLVYGQGIVDRQAGKLIWKIPDESNRYRYGMRHVASDDCVLSVINEGSKFVLASVRLPAGGNRSSCSESRGGEGTELPSDDRSSATNAMNPLHAGTSDPFDRQMSSSSDG